MVKKTLTKSFLLFITALILVLIIIASNSIFSNLLNKDQNNKTTFTITTKRIDFYPLELDKGCYYITKDICRSCKNGQIFSTLESICLSDGFNLKIAPLEMWTDTEKNNFLMERAMNVEFLDESKRETLIEFLKGLFLKNTLRIILIKNDQKIIQIILYDSISLNEWENIRALIWKELKIK